MILLYLIKCFVSMGMAWSIYKLLLADKKSFLFNRFFLLISLIGITLIPFYTFPTEVLPVIESFTPSMESVLSSYDLIEPEVIITSAPDTLNSTSTDTFNIVWIFYGISILLLLRLMFNIINLSWRARNNFFRQEGNINVVSYNSKNTPFSFFNNLFVSEKDIKDGLPESIMRHEQCHINHLHSVDRLIAELVLVFQWWNPFAYLLVRDLKDNHEYTADAFAIAKTKATELYVNCLLERSIGTVSNGVFQIGFAQPSILKRLKMVKLKADELSIGQAVPISIVMLLLIISCVGSVGEKINLENSYVDVSYEKGPFGKSSYPTKILDKMGDKYYHDIPEYRSPDKRLFEKFRFAPNYTVLIDGKKIGKATREKLIYEGIKSYSVKSINTDQDDDSNFFEDEKVTVAYKKNTEFLATLFTQSGYFSHVEEKIRKQDECDAVLLHGLRLDDVLWRSLSTYSKDGGAPQASMPKMRRPTIELLDKFRGRYNVFINGESKYLHSEDPTEFSYYVENVTSEGEKSVELITNAQYQKYLDILKNGAYKSSSN